MTAFLSHILSHLLKFRIEKKAPLTQVIKSIMAAFLGVQSEENRAKDFTTGKASQFIIVAIIGVIVFIVLLSFIVSLVVPS